MDKKELLKRWALAYTEPSLFYVPWSKNQKPYGEYITVQFETPECTFEDWQRDPVFAIYRADDVEYKTPIYCTALYDKDCNMIRNGIINRQYFKVCSEYGSASTEVILLSGKYKIKMLCSGGGMITNGLEEWEFEIERGTNNNPIYSSDIDYSYRTVTIDPFKGYKYLQIDCEAELVKTCKSSDLVSKSVLQSFDVSGYSYLSICTDPYKKSYTQYFPMEIRTVDDFIDQHELQFYLLNAVINEKIYDSKHKINTIKSQRGKKKIIRNKEYDDYWNLTFGRYLQFTDYNKVDYVQYNLNDYDIECSFLLGGDFNPYEAIYQYFFYADCSSYGYLHTKVNFKIKNNDEIGKPELSSLYITNRIINNNNFVIFNIKYKNKYSYREYSGDSNIDPIVDINFEPTFAPDRYNAYKTSELQYKEKLKEDCELHYQDEKNYIIKERTTQFSVPISSIITNEMPEGEIRDLDKYYVELQNTMFYYKHETIGTQVVPFSHKVIDLGVDWSNYDNYQNEDKWSGTILYNAELEVYHPELIPKEKAGET